VKAAVRVLQSERATVRRRIRLAICAVVATILTDFSPAVAGSWNWTAHLTVAGSEVTARAQVTLDRTELVTITRLPVADKPEIVSPCRARIADIERASAIRTGAAASLQILMRPNRIASCSAIGERRSIVLPADDYAFAARIAEAINDACCAVATAPPLRAALRPSSVVPVRGMSVEDWVRREDAFAFIRIRNDGSGPIAVGGIEVRECVRVDYGCGSIDRRFTIAPGRTATVATVASADPQAEPSFVYRYDAKMALYSYAGRGSSQKAAPAGATSMSAREIREAEAVALAAMGRSVAPPNAPPHLLTRGTSQLANGETGVVRVRIVIAPDGRPRAASIVSTTNPKLAAAALEVAASSTYVPALRDGRPVIGTLLTSFGFSNDTPPGSNIPPWRRAGPLPTSRP